MHQTEMLFGPSLRDCGVLEHTRFDTFMLRFLQTHIMIHKHPDCKTAKERTCFERRRSSFLSGTLMAPVLNC